MNASSQKALWLTSTIVCVIIFAAISLLPLAVGVWLPDVFLSSPRTLASEETKNGYSFRVIQYWNHVDFYSTELHIISPDGTTAVHTLDGDDSKRWGVPLVVDASNRGVSVTLGRGVQAKERW
jgi:hypothetical protein